MRAFFIFYIQVLDRFFQNNILMVPGFLILFPTLPDNPKKFCPDRVAIYRLIHFFTPIGGLQTLHGTYPAATASSALLNVNLFLGLIFCAHRQDGR